MTSLTVYTDGSACNTGKDEGYGGWGAVVLYNELRIEMLGNDDHPTNSNRMELLAAIHALRTLEKGCTVTLYTDSEYVLTCISNGPTWKGRGYYNNAMRKCKNIDLLDLLLASEKGLDIQWNHVKGHSGVKWNERADELATQARHYAIKGVWVKKHVHSIALTEGINQATIV